MRDQTIPHRATNALEMLTPFALHFFSIFFVLSIEYEAVTVTVFRGALLSGLGNVCPPFLSIQKKQHQS